ncbi:MAG: helix-turn-helix transcriptional regulator [Gilliamella sp.]|nr:helix-turn-helix transcriptional regulator [Gilliamella sp.]
MNRLKELRIKNNLTLDDIEAKTGIKRGTYSNYENNKTEPKIETWKKLADYFNVSTSYLMGLNSNDFGDKIKELRIKHGLSQGDLAEKIGLTRQAISNYENNERTPNDKIWQKLADCFNVSIPSARGEINVELIAKIAKATLLISCNRSDFKTKKEYFPNDEDARTIAITELMLLLFEELRLDHTREFNELVTKNANLLKLKGKKKADYIKGASDSATDENYNIDIQNAKALIDLYDNL